MDAPRRIEINAGGFTLPFTATRFRARAGMEVFVYFCTWENRPSGPGRGIILTDSLRADSLRQVWNRERRLGQQVLELAVTGLPDTAAADSEARRTLENGVRPVGK
jgi:hypothetical protein